MTALPAARTFATDAAIGAVQDHGAHVLSWTPAGHDPVLWMSARSWFEHDKPIRGGVPICLPWFGTGVQGDLAPAHGTARLRTWQLRSSATGPEGADAEYVLELPPNEAFPHSLHAEYRVHLGRTLELALTVTNTGETECVVEEALHTYLAVGDIHQVHIEGLDGARYIDKAPGGAQGRQRQDGDVIFAGETDRVYVSTGSLRLVDPSLRRAIIVERSGSANAVVWNPWSAKATAMPDFGDDEWPGMVCIEGANVHDQALHLAPGASHEMHYRLSVEHLG